MEDKKVKIDLGEVWKTLKSKKKIFLKIWAVTFVLSCIWIFPQPRFYAAEVILAPEAAGEGSGGLAGIASSFGLNIGGGSADALYPALYPDIMTSNEFIAGLMPITITTQPKEKNEEPLTTDYYTYIKNHQNKNYLIYPIFYFIKQVKKLSGKEHAKPIKAEDLNYFKLSEDDTELFERVTEKISCSVDKKTDVITISVKDQDALVCATMADSVRQHLQDFIVKYRTQKARIDVEHYQHLADSANVEYLAAVDEYARYCDANQLPVLQVNNSQRDVLENAMSLKYNTYQTLATQLEVMKTKLQERTPAFTVLKPAVVPVKPEGPKRVRFVFGTLLLVTFVSSAWFLRSELKKLVV
ncbi:MAG: chain-length determining protein [Prevotellaceae bacterium]|nr:chain-length determining protein [Candidatus Minthosoma equi]